MNFEALLNRQLKDDDVIEVLELLDMQVVYEFDRTHENLEDIYWATAPTCGIQFRFNKDQKLDVVFLYIVASEGISPVARDEVDVPLFESFDEAKRSIAQARIPFVESPNQKWWIKGDFGVNTRHYQYQDGELFRVTLSAKAA